MKIHKAVFILILAFACKQDPSLDVVTVSGNQLLINQLPYYMKGICYHPVPKGETRRDFGSIDQDLALMIEAGINEGDTVIIRRTDTADNGKIVVALIDEHEAMLKRIRKKGKVVALESANRNYETKIFGPDRVKVQGVLVSLYRNF